MKNRILMLKEKIEVNAQCNDVKTEAGNEVLTIYRYVARYVTRHQKNRKFLSIKIRRYEV